MRNWLELPIGLKKQSTRAQKHSGGGASESLVFLLRGTSSGRTNPCDPPRGGVEPILHRHEEKRYGGAALHSVETILDRHKDKHDGGAALHSVEPIFYRHKEKHDHGATLLLNIGKGDSDEATMRLL